MRMIEGSLRFAGYTATLAVFGNKFSYEAKASKKSMMIFEIGQEPFHKFHILLYDMAYINVQSIKVWSDDEFKTKLELSLIHI